MDRMLARLQVGLASEACQRFQADLRARSGEVRLVMAAQSLYGNPIGFMKSLLGVHFAEIFAEIKDLQGEFSIFRQSIHH